MITWYKTAMLGSQEGALWDKTSKELTSFKVVISYVCRAVIKRRGGGIFPGCYERGPRLLSQENRRKIGPKEIPSCYIPCLLVAFTQQLEILVKSLVCLLPIYACLRLFIVYADIPFGSRFGQVVSKIRCQQMSSRNRVYHSYKSVSFTEKRRENLKVVSRVDLKKRNTTGKTENPYQTFLCSWKFSTEIF